MSEGNPGQKGEAQAMRKTIGNSFLTPIALGENPELGALWILKTTLEVAELALVASYPESCEDSERRRTEEEAYALALLYQIDSLEALLDEYSESIRRKGQWRNRESSEEGIPF